jgi:DNA-binding SARP family transcriptional activator
MYRDDHLTVIWRSYGVPVPLFDSPFPGGDMSRIRLAVLGQMTAFTTDGAELTGLRRGPRLLSLLAYCALEGRGRWLSLEPVLELFWEAGGDLARARRALNQLVSTARIELHTPLLERDNGRIRLSPDITCDAAELLYGDPCPDAVADLAGAELLPGVEGGHDFKEWLSRTRHRLRRQMVAVLTTPAADLDAPAMLRRGRAALLLDAGNDAAAQMVIAGLARSGARGEAWQFFEEHRSTLDREFMLAPSSALTAVVTRECGSGSPADARWAVAQSSSRRDDGATAVHPAPAPATGAVPPAEAVRLRRNAGKRVLSVTAGSLALMLAFQAVVYVRLDTPGVRGLQSGDRTADLVIDMHAPAGSDVWSMGVVPLLSHRLSDRGMRVSHASAAALMAAPFVLRGTVSGTVADHISGVIQLHDVASGALIGSWQLTSAASNVDDALAAIADSIRESAGRRVTLHAIRSSGRSPAAIDALLAARSSYEVAVAALRTGGAAIADDALAWADVHASRASRLDPAWSQPYLLRAEMLERRTLRAAASGDRAAALGLLDAAISEATAALERGAELQALELRGGLYYLAWALNAGLPDARQRAEQELGLVVASGAASAHALATLSGLHHAAGRTRDALAAAEGALRRDVFGRRTTHILLRLHDLAFDEGRLDDARQWCAEIRRRSPGQWQSSYCALRSMAWDPSASAEQIEALLVDLSREPKPIADMAAPRLELTRAAVLASNGFGANARRIIDSIDPDDQTDSEILFDAAAARAQIGDLVGAAALFARFAETAGPAAHTSYYSRWLDPLRRAVTTDALLSVAEYQDNTTAPR